MIARNTAIAGTKPRPDRACAEVLSDPGVKEGGADTVTFANAPAAASGEWVFSRLLIRFAGHVSCVFEGFDGFAAHVLTEPRPALRSDVAVIAQPS
ncbi:MAG: hypothetical protein AAF689_16510 [Pseudomonadota bacterium]